MWWCEWRGSGSIVHAFRQAGLGLLCALEIGCSRTGLEVFGSDGNRTNAKKDGGADSPDSAAPHRPDGTDEAPPGRGVSAVATKIDHTCAILGSGVQCWGWNNFGQLGNNSMVNSSVPVVVQGLDSGVQAVATGMGNTCALVNGSVFCWGKDGEAR